MAKLSKEQWLEAREIWERDERDGFDWLSTHFNGVVSRQAISKTAKAKGWSKKHLDNDVLRDVAAKVAQPKKVAVKVAENVAQPIREDDSEQSKSKGGRPTKYKSEYAEQARKLCLIGKTNEYLAEFFDVCITTIQVWLRDIPEFMEAVKAGRVVADANVAASFYDRAIGYSHQETKVFCNAGEIITCDVTKHYPPDAGAAMNWLANRVPEHFRKSPDPVVNINMNLVPKEELDEIHQRNLEKQKEMMAVVMGRAARLGIVTSYIDSEANHDNDQ